MTTNNRITYVDINEGAELVPYFTQIAALFLECFEKPLDKRLWDWAYLQNPSGSPFVSLAFCEGLLVGHYAAIPMPLKNDNNELSGFLSMTTMVSSPFRRDGLFTLLANRVNNSIESLGEPAVIFGFPNDNSAPGFRKRLGWIISDEYKVVRVDENSQIECANLLKKSVSKSCYTFHLDTQELVSWRTNKPLQEWSIYNGVGLKTFDGGSDLMYLKTPELFERMKIEKDINAILPVGNSSKLETTFSYRFGYKTLGFLDENEPKFFVQMCMSDIF